GIIGLLTSAGVPEPDAQVFAEGLRRGGTLVSARVDDALAEMAFDVLRRANGIDIADLRRIYEQEGWSGFDDNAVATPEQEGEARDRYPFVPPFL
ncbi:MAG TPA: hypothetical protein VGD93_07430, partial [Devosia sp.]